MFQVTNQLVQSCKDHIKQLTQNVIEDRDELWDKVADEVSTRDLLNHSDPNQKSLGRQLENRLKVSKARVNNY